MSKTGIHVPAKKTRGAHALDRLSGGSEQPSRCFTAAVEAAEMVDSPESSIATEYGIGTDAFAAACRKLDHRPIGYRAIKRAFDIAFSACTIAVGLVPCALLSVAIAVDTKGSPIYSQERIGRLGRSFRIYKFRTMVFDADDVERHLDADQLAEWHREHKVTNDPRITPLGRVLRKTSLDELPQFLNVLIGRMSVVGPRAITSEELGEFAADVTTLLSVPQGVTGAWQAGPRNEATFENGERQRVELEYARGACFKEDVRIFLATFGAMFARRSGR